MAKASGSLDDDKARPRGDTGDGDTGVPPDEQGISNRAGDADEPEDAVTEDSSEGED
jgi:hypothetical protein